MSYRSSSVSAAIASFEIFGGGSSRCHSISQRIDVKLRELHTYLNFLRDPSNIQSQRVSKALVVKQGMASFPSTTAVEAMKAYVQARVVILEESWN